MKLEADISGSYVALRVPDDAFVDAGAASQLAGLEVGVEPDLRVGENERRSTHMSVSFSREKGREIAVTLAQKLGLPAFTEPEWLEIAGALAALHADNLRGYVDTIRAAYAEGS
jgi:hypothetical protein